MVKYAHDYDPQRVMLRSQPFPIDQPDHWILTYTPLVYSSIADYSMHLNINARGILGMSAAASSKRRMFKGWGCRRMRQRLDHVEECRVDAEQELSCQIATLTSMYVRALYRRLFQLVAGI